MFRFWLEFHPLLTLLALTFVFATTAGVTHWLQCHSPLRSRIKQSILAAPTFVSVSTLFALFAAFLLASAIDQKTRALQAVENEGSALMMLSVNSEAADKNGGAIRGGIRGYVSSLLGDEWPLMRTGRGSDKTEQALLALMRTVRDGPAADDVKSPVHGQMLASVQKVADGRATRIAIVSHHVQQFAWSALFLLGFITQFAIGMAHLEPPSNRMAIGLFSLGAVIGLWLIAIQDNPFRGFRPVSPAPIEKVVMMPPAR